MRFLILDTCYPAFLRAHYERAPGLASRPYQEQWAALMATFFGTADSYSHALQELGHEAHEVVANCEPLQRAWAREHDVRTPRLRRRPSEAVVRAQAAAFRPDVVYVQNMQHFSPALLGELRRGGALVAGQIASEPPPDDVVRAFDLVLTSFPHFVDRLGRLGVRTAYLRIGFDPRVLARLETERAQRDRHAAVFVGALNRTQHREGNELLERAARRAPLEFWGYRAQGWPPGSSLRSRYRGEAWGIDMFRVLYEARIAVNRHIGVAEGYANNMRLYEATGVGTLLLTDGGRNLADLFEPGREVAVYRDEDDLVAQIEHYLAHEDERHAIARAGQERTLHEHTYQHRMKDLLEIVGREAR
ncbi:MAG: CgeB family protein [Gaiellaceae bacterium]